MDYVNLGKSGLKVSRLTLGCWAFAGGDAWGEQSEKDSIDVIRASVDQGINLLDTAQAYGDGESERVVGLGVAGIRDKVLIATKVPQNVNSKAELIAECEGSLERLGTDFIDLYQVHWPLRSMPFEEVVDAMRSLQAAGKIREAGVCNYGVRDMGAQLAAGGMMVSNQIPYSMLTRAIEYEVLPACELKNVSALVYSPLMQGLLTGKFKTAADVPDGRARSRHFSKNRVGVRHGEDGFEEETFAAIGAVAAIAEELGKPMEQVALAWALRGQMVASLIVGARNTEQLNKNIQSVELDLSDDAYGQLSKATDPLKAAMGKNPDLWNAVSRIQ